MCSDLRNEKPAVTNATTVKAFRNRKSDVEKRQWSSLESIKDVTTTTRKPTSLSDTANNHQFTMSSVTSTSGTQSPPLDHSGQNEPLGVSNIAGDKHGAVPDSKQREGTGSCFCVLTFAPQLTFWFCLEYFDNPEGAKTNEGKMEQVSASWMYLAARERKF
jgi:hypothetical protein